ncbi:MAG: hypothetical protein ABJG78_01800 [Cyclobacteriaceae bacterium]
MEKLIFLVESDKDLRENITELLELEGYDVVCLTSDETKSVFQSYHAGLVVFNTLTLSEPIDEFVRFLKNKVDGIVAFCSNDEDPQINEADIKILLPFDYQELLHELFNFTNCCIMSEVELH